MTFKKDERVRWIGRESGSYYLGRTGSIRVEWYSTKKSEGLLGYHVIWDDEPTRTEFGGRCYTADLELIPPTPKLDKLFSGTSSFVTKDSGEREEFGNGSLRDSQEGKPRYDLISPIAAKRKAELMARGAEKYGERNWEKGQPLSRFLSSAMRHLEMYRLGDRSEDHLAAVGYNDDAMMHFEGTEWDDLN